MSGSLYLCLGWTGLVSGAIIWKRYGFRFMSPLLYRGIAYSIGVVFEAAAAAMSGFQPVPGIAGGHDVFHLAVLAGMGTHWKLIGGFAAQSRLGLS